jgi:hypothetical protein
MKPLFSLLALLALTACSSECESAGRHREEVVPPAVKGEVSTTETVGETGRNHGYIRRFYQNNGRYYVSVDYIRFLSGAAAVTAARRRHDAQEEVVSGDTIYSVFDDHYIINDDTRQRTLPLNEQATFTLWDKSGDLRQYTVTAAEALEKDPDLLRYAPFIIETKQGTVTSITEQYVS